MTRLKLKETLPKVALTELFLELKTDETPSVVERIVKDINAIVRGATSLTGKTQ